MKQLLLAIALAALTISAQAQSTNIVDIRVRYADGVATNNVNINLTSRESEGFLLNWEKDTLMALQQTNSVPSIQQSIRSTVNIMLLAELARQARANDQKTNKFDLFFTFGGQLYNADVFTAAQKQALKDIITSPNVATNLPSQ